MSAFKKWKEISDLGMEAYFAAFSNSFDNPCGVSIGE